MKRDNHMPFPPELEGEGAGASESDRQRFERVWRVLGRAEARTLDVPDIDAAWVEVRHRVEADRKPRTARGRAPDRGAVSRRSPWMRQAAVALGVLVMLLAAGWLWRLPVTVEAVPGEQKTVTLPDGSVVELNSDSRLQYARGFQAWPFVPAARRAVTLDGEGFFQVARGGRPFVVATFHARVEVAGTQFNVRTRQRSTSVTLASGRVRVTTAGDANRAVTLQQEGGRVRVTEREMAAEQVSAEALDRVLAWRRQGFAAVEQPISEILAELERRYALEIDVPERLALTDSMSLFYLHGAAPEQILHDICLSQGWHYRRTSRGFAVLDGPAG